MDGPYSLGFDYDQFGNMTHRYGWGGEVQGGGADQTSHLYYTYSNGKNQRDGFTYDPAGNLTNDQAQNYSYDAMGQQASASAYNYFLSQSYDGDGLRGFKVENGTTTYYLRSSVLGGQAVAELDGNGGWSRGYVYAGDGLMAVQEGGQLYWVHEDSVTKSKRITDVYGNIVSTVELDPWGAGTNRSSNAAFLPQSFTTYIRDANGGQDAMARRYSASSRFAQPDPYGGSYNFSDPQSLNRYAYTKNDPVNFRDPSGLNMATPGSASGILWRLWYGNNDTGWKIVSWWFEAYPNNGDDVGGSEPQNPGLTPFTGKNLRKYDKQRAIVRDSLENSDSCRQFLAAHGIDPDAALDAVNQQLAYNGPKSTISRLQAGTVDLSDPDFQSMQLNDPTRAAAILNGPVSGDFRSAGLRAETAFYPGGVFGPTVADRSTVFFRKSGLTGGNILHEALHSLTGLNDALLAGQLGVQIPSSGVTDIITQTLIQHGCGASRKR